MCDWELQQEIDDGSIWDYVYDLEHPAGYRIYESYRANGEEEAAWIVRRLVKAINTRNKWVDIISCCIDDDSPTFKFEWIVAEIFPKRLKPDYSDCESEYRGYNTWWTLREDVDAQREQGVKGRKFLILCDTIDLNEGKILRTYTRIRTLKKILGT